MKKNWTMRVAVLMVALTLITACFVSGTFAKYVTSDDIEDNARVAKFGVTVTGTSDLFSTTYETHDNNYSADNSVISSGDDRLVAPGTSGTLTQFGLTGTPEVAVRISYEVEDFSLAGWAVAEDAYYCPLIITVGAETLDGANYTSLDDFEAAVIEAIEDEDGVIEAAANTDLSTLAANGLSVGWSWPFSTSADNDVKDTYLGDAAAAGNAATIDLQITCTVTQID